MTLTPWRRMIALVLVLWGIEGINIILAHSLNYLGLIPRTPVGLLGIFTAPFLHGNIWHLLNNTVPFVILGAFVGYIGKDTWWRTTIFIVLVGGALTWIFGRKASHVGASGLIFGWWAFLLSYGFYHRSLKSIVIAFATLFLYGGLAWGLIHLQKTISVESHIFGALAGFLSARLQARKKQPSAPT
ncbi:MAG: rhomboid family intramembrane serine protease [Pseudomonadales bacterium]|uniref:S54 (Rhomboid) family peptidase n=1 Tax=Oleiphilus messinensis TaxID=141451 RepID=A0A1Y0I1E1_9GAMM|nr:rhomboid family intramembrane serine protease [Oleiphilus messinensis]ARU54277.1 S54 (rhomboid) family peptidase [Oleiphilus messinensis]MCG8610877.1 rhomboid family intramembrane serine protease [Pseudomonadales bacterium]